jgi:hypothetical protein
MRREHILTDIQCTDCIKNVSHLWYDVAFYKVHVYNTVYTTRDIAFNIRFIVRKGYICV